MIHDLISNKNTREKAAIKGAEIAKSLVPHKNKRGIFDIEIVTTNPIDGGVEIFARVWKNGKQIGFGADGTVDIERFRFFNPPILVPDENGDIVQEWADKNGELKSRRLRESPQDAFLDAFVHTLSVMKNVHENEQIVSGKLGNTTSTFYPSYDALLYKYGSGASRAAAWDSLHDATASDAVVNSALPVGDYGGVGVATGGAAADVEIVRVGVFFDTSAIPDTDDISSATLSLYVTQKANSNNDGRDYINIVQATPAANTVLVTGDFDQIGAIDNPAQGATAIDIGSITTSAYNDWVLNATGRGWISKTSITTFGVREGHDIEDVLHSTSINQYNDIRFYHVDQAGTTNDPKLVVEHAASTTPALSFGHFA